MMSHRDVPNGPGHPENGDATPGRRPGVVPLDAARTVRHEARFLPNISLNPRGAQSAACRARFDGRSLREAAEFVCDCETAGGERPDDYTALAANQSGTIGAKQALLAILAAEAGRHDLQLIVGCCEMPLPPVVPARLEFAASWPRTLPLAVVWLRNRGRRLQIVDPRHASLRTLTLVTETVVDPAMLPIERRRLYAEFAADWCRALEVPPAEFTRLRSWQLRVSANTSVFEDLLGYLLPAGYLPAV